MVLLRHAGLSDTPPHVTSGYQHSLFQEGCGLTTFPIQYVPTLGSSPQGRRQIQGLKDTERLQGRQKFSIIVAGTLTATFGVFNSMLCPLDACPAQPGKKGGNYTENPHDKSYSKAINILKDHKDFQFVHDSENNTRLEYN